MYGYIYKTTNLINGKIYIGQHKSNGFVPYYFGSGTYLKNSINKYGINNFKVDILEEINDINDMNYKEIYYIKKYNSTNHNIGYNIEYGGHIIHSEETRKRISASKKGQKPSYKTINNSIISRRLNGTSKKGTIIINNGINEKYIKPEMLDEYLKDGWFKGRCELSKIKISNTLTGIKRPPMKDKTKMILSELNKGKKLSEKTKSILRKNSMGNKSNSGRVWMNNGVNNHTVLVCDIEKFKNNNYTFGRLNYK